MDDNIYELLTKMYSDMTEQFKELNKKVDNKADKSDIIRLENELNPKVEALLDGYRQLSEGQEDIKAQLKDVQSKVSNQELEITVLKGGKQAVR